MLNKIHNRIIMLIVGKKPVVMNVRLSLNEPICIEGSGVFYGNTMNGFPK